MTEDEEEGNAKDMSPQQERELLINVRKELDQTQRLAEAARRKGDKHELQKQQSKAWYYRKKLENLGVKVGKLKVKRGKPIDRTENDIRIRTQPFVLELPIEIFIKPTVKTDPIEETAQ